MELINKFANITKNLSAKFPDLDEFYLYVHTLGYISGFDQPLYFVSAYDSVIVPNIILDKTTSRKIAEVIVQFVNQYSEKEKKELCKYFLELCLQFETRIDFIPKSPSEFFDKLLVTDPQAVSKQNEEYSVNFSELSAKSQIEYLNWNIEQYFYYKNPRIPKQIVEKVVAFADPKKTFKLFTIQTVVTVLYSLNFITSFLMWS